MISWRIMIMMLAMYVELQYAGDIKNISYSIGLFLQSCDSDTL